MTKEVAENWQIEANKCQNRKNKNGREIADNSRALTDD